MNPKIICKPWRANPAYLKPVCKPWRANPAYLTPPEPDCYECWGLRRMFKRNAPKCIVCRGDVPEHILPQRTRFGTDSKTANKGHAASRRAKAAKMVKTG